MAGDSKPGVIDIQDLAHNYGALNDLVATNFMPLASRRGTDSTTAWRQALAQLNTPDALSGMSQFRGLVLQSTPSAWPRRESPESFFQSCAVNEVNSPFEATAKGLFYYYKVWVPEMDPIPMDFSKEGLKDIKVRIVTLGEMRLSTDLVIQGMEKRISPGTLVTVKYADLSRVGTRGASIIDIGPLLFSVDITGQTANSAFPFGRPPSQMGLLGRDGDHIDPARGSNAAAAAQANTKPAIYTPDAIKRCADAYDSDTNIGGRRRAHNDQKISILHNEFQPYCKCFVAKCHEKGISLKINSTYRSVAWQTDHRRWYVEGDSRQTILCATAWGDPRTRTNKVVRGNSSTITKPHGGSWHQVGWAFDFNPTIPMPDGSQKILKNNSAKSLWQQSGIGDIAAAAGVNWGGGFNDAIHNGGGSAIKNLTQGAMKKAHAPAKLARDTGVAGNMVDLSSYTTGSGTN